MRLDNLLSFLLCLAVASAQMAMPITEAKGRGGRDKDKGKGGKGDKEPVRGGASALQSRITDLRKRVAEANDTVVPFEGGTLKGLVGLLKVNEAIVTLGSTIDVSTKAAEATNALPANESTQIGTQFLGLQPEINNLLTEVQGKRAEFDKAGFRILDVRSLIRDSVVIQKDKAGDLGGAFTKALDPTFQPFATQISDQIQGNFTAAIDEYDGRAGKIKIPSKAVPVLTDLLAGVARALGVGGRNKALAGPVTEAEAASIPMTNYASAESAFADIGAADTPEANIAAQEALRGGDDFSRLDPDENDLRGIPPLVLAVLRRYEII
ncbi:hypothetical protein BDP81DRAFT_512270 [Colletotrichum phormii]|uniref:Antigenic cell wall n=1 Tax=Colletotrichum phormii TaxID=359342 RepID=A0AAJ0EHS8_9PEZI|nr:uncharacterized protein BDP81DRAFT_512270 [Colletotrichum phormii]KAK1639324.1 hypothetical protein BDP81DRAFT_512270 [Colletotrichum phormii]